MHYLISIKRYNRPMENIELTQSILQYPTDLVFAVTQVDVSTELTILQSQDVVLDDYLIKFAIIGESHCVTVLRRGQLVLQEVLACMEIPQILQAESHKFATLKPYCFTRLGYRSQVWFADCLDVSGWQPQQSIRLDFPEMYGQIPFTKVGWVVRSNSLQWRTIHVYPLETHTTYVYSETFFDLTERSNNE